MKLGEATVKYVASPEWANLSYRSRRIYSNGFTSLQPLMERHVKTLTRKDILEFRDSLYTMPGKCRVALMTLNNIYRYLLDRGMVNYNPSVKINGLTPTKPIPRWEEAEIDKFLSTAPAYLKSAMLLALYTGQRLSDLVRMRWEDYDGKTIKVKQKKTGKELLLPVHPRLKADLDVREAEAQDAPQWRPFILWGKYGDPIGPGALSSAIMRHARRIGLKGRSIHGVRKTCASILAESGCSPMEIMAVTGHKSLKEVQRYTLEANQLTMAKEAVRKWDARGREGETTNANEPT